MGKNGTLVKLLGTTGTHQEGDSRLTSKISRADVRNPGFPDGHYLDTVFLQNNALQGLRSRILGMGRSVSMDDIDKIEIYTELSKETPAARKDEEEKPDE